MITTVDQFRDAIEQAGLTPPDAIVLDGQFHRFASNGDRDDDAGWYVVFPNGIPAGSFGCFRLGITQTWCGKSEKTFTEQERLEHRKRIKAIQQQRDAEERQRHADAARSAQELWSIASPASDDHPYLTSKQVKAHGLRVDRENRLIIPVTIDQTLTSVETIAADGTKRYLRGGRKQGGSFTFGDLEHAHILLLGEGFATVATLHEATAYPAVMAFDAGNLLLVAQQLRRQYPAATIVLCGDNDLHADGTENTGVLKATAAAHAIQGLVAIPEAINNTKTDWNDVHRHHGLDAVRKAIEIVLTPPLPGVHSGIFSPVTAPQLLDEEEPTQLAWIWEDFLPEGSLGALVAKPKVGKTTNAYELGVKVAQGLPYLGRTTRRGPVLILALEEHRREVKRRLRNLGADHMNDLHVHVGPLADTPDTFHQLTQYIGQHGIILVLLDTLNSFWSVQEENNATDVTRAIKPLLTLARDSGAAVLLLHHARKSDGEYGDEIRGSGALFSLLDVALILKRHDVETQRKLTAISRYPETPPELIIELRDHGHEALGDLAAVGKAAKMEKVRFSLTETPTPAAEIAKRAGVAKGAAYTLLDQLVTKGQAQRTGTGKRNDPYLYCRFVSVSPLRGGGVNETNSSPDPNDHESSSSGGFVSFRGTFPKGNTKRNDMHNDTEKDGLVSFRGTGGQTKRNGAEESTLSTEELLTEEVVTDED